MPWTWQKKERKERISPPKKPVMVWHTLPEEEIWQKLHSTMDGLSEDQVLERQQQFGSNALPVKEPPSLVTIFFHQFFSPLIYVLLIAGSVSLLIGDHTDALFIFAVILLNAGLGTFQEWKAEKSAAALQRLLRIYTHVKRGGVERQIPAEELVPGDVVFLESGSRVPADLRLIWAHNLALDESLLTGESLPIEKHTGVLAEHIPLSERMNMAFAGSTVTVGRGFGVVVATGSQTEVGQIARMVTFAETTNPPWSFVWSNLLDG
jgi:magnesium-transporting ATPase (P-type)